MYFRDDDDDDDDDDDLLIYYSDKYIYVNITHTNKYVLIIHYTQPNKAYQSLVANNIT